MTQLAPTPATELTLAVRDALAELLLTLADDEFVVGFWDSEWTGIGPMLEEDVAFSSMAQDELGHARAFYELLATLTGRTADEIAFGRPPEDYRHARLLDHPRTDWAFSVARRYLYDTADAVRLEPLATSAYAPLAELVTKIRREERYHLLHVDAWLRRLATSGEEPRRRLVAALDRLQSDAATVFTPLAWERTLLDAGVLSVPMEDLRTRWVDRLHLTFTKHGLPTPESSAPAPDGRTGHSEDFRWLWGEFTSVYRSEAGATW
ncbi:phenylacetate-CoA oxygenase subunit PaaC [soil metagenome]